MSLLRPFRRLRGLALLGALCLAAASAPGFAAEEQPRVRLVTSLGNIDIELFPERAPKTVENFLARVEEGFYDGLIFHRVVANFVIQAGGYDAGMNYREPPGTVVNESFNGLRNRRGTVAMARQADPDSADTQFFINVNDNAHLDAMPGRPGYTVFARVIDGMDVVTEIELVATHRQSGMAAVPVEPVVIQNAQIL